MTKFYVKYDLISKSAKATSLTKYLQCKVLNKHKA